MQLNWKFFTRKTKLTLLRTLAFLPPNTIPISKQDITWILRLLKQVRIQDLVGEAPASETESCWCCVSEASNLWLGSRARLRALEAFGFLMLKYAFSHILETLFLSFLTSILTPNVDKNRALEFTSINLKHSYILHLFFNLHEKVML